MVCKSVLLYLYHHALVQNRSFLHDWVHRFDQKVGRTQFQADYLDVPLAVGHRNVDEFVVASQVEIGKQDGGAGFRIGIRSDINDVCQLTPATPVLLPPIAPMVPATCVP